MVTYTAAFVAAMLLALVTTPLVRLAALKAGAVSTVGGRNVNTKVMPRLGGVAIALSAMAPIFLLFWVESEVARYIRGQGLLAAGLAFGAVTLGTIGAFDDVRGIRALHKLLVQLLCASVAYAAGFQIHAIALPFVGTLDMGVFALPVTILWIVGVTNAVNLIDGLDGLAAGVVFCAAGTNLVVAAIGGNVFVAVIMAAIMGSLFGFLFYNFNPAKIFMGDSGSYFLGFVLASVSLVGNQKASTAVSLLVPVLALGVPIFDTLFSIVRRTLERRPIFSPDRGHVHHRLLDIGLTHRRAVLVLYSLSLAFAVSAVAVSLGRDWQTGVAILVAMALVVGLVRFVGNFREAQRAAVAPTGWDFVVERLDESLPDFVLALGAEHDPLKRGELLRDFAPAFGLSGLRFVPDEPKEVDEEDLVFRPRTGAGALVVTPGTSGPCPEAARLAFQLCANLVGRAGG